MADTDLYDMDILAWSEQQAAALRELASRRDLPNALDLAHVVEEIEDVGASQVNAVKSFTRLLLAPVIRCWADPGAQSVRHWYAEIANWQSELLDRYTPSMDRKIDLDQVWRRAVEQAMLELIAQEREVFAAKVGAVLAGTPCPISLSELIDDCPRPAAIIGHLARHFPSPSDHPAAKSLPIVKRPGKASARKSTK